MATGTTLSTKVIIPQVLADMVQAKLTNVIRFTPLAEVDNSLVGRPGDTLTVPAWDYIGDAVNLTEGESVEVTQMSSMKKEMKVNQAAKAVEITDYALEVGYDNALEAAAEQIAMAHASKIDSDFVEALRGASLTETATGGLTVDNIDLALEKFGDEDVSEFVILANGKNARNLIKDARKLLINTEVGANVLINGTLAKIDNGEVVRSNRLNDNEAYLVRKGALRLVKKADVNIETDRDILKFSTVISSDSIYGAYLFDAKKAVKITVA